MRRHPLLGTVIALLLLCIPTDVQAQASTDPLALVAISRWGDSLTVTIRANADMHTISIRLTGDGGAIAGLPTIEATSWVRNQHTTWTFSLLRDIDAAALAWQVTIWGEPTRTGTIPVLVPDEAAFDPLILTSISRDADALRVSLRANEPLAASIVRLTANGAVAGLPEWQRTNWSAGEVDSWSYQLTGAATRATLEWEISRSGGATRTGKFDIDVPTASDGSDTPRLVVTSAHLRGTTAVLNVTNHGGATARNAVVWIEDAAQRRIAAPFTRVIATLAPGAHASVEFALPENVVDVVVALDAGNGTQRTPVTLQRLGAAANATFGEVNVSLSTDLPFREVDLGSSADYAVQVRNLGAPALVQLRIDGLPPGYSARFFVGGSAVPSLYLANNQTRQATLSVVVPSARDEVDRTVDFSVVASVNGTEAESLDMGVAVRGVGQLDVSSSDGEVALPPGGQATFQVVVRNTGSAPIFNVDFDSRRPYGWTVRVEPRRLDRIEPGGTSAVSVEVRSPDVIGGGRYSVDVAAKSGDLTSRYVPLAVNVDEVESGGGWVWGALLVAIAGILGFAGWRRWRG